MEDIGDNISFKVKRNNILFKPTRSNSTNAVKKNWDMCFYLEKCLYSEKWDRSPYRDHPWNRRFRRHQVLWKEVRPKFRAKVKI